MDGYQAPGFELEDDDDLFPSLSWLPDYNKTFFDPQMDELGEVLRKGRAAAAAAPTATAPAPMPPPSSDDDAVQNLFIEDDELCSLLCLAGDNASASVLREAPSELDGPQGNVGVPPQAFRQPPAAEEIAVPTVARPDESGGKRKAHASADRLREEAEEQQSLHLHPKRTRAAEIHNQSEKRRRNKINVKMRELQQLIPRCNKSDKAAMLEDAVEYTKSLQYQLKAMSMGYGMPAVMFPPRVAANYVLPMGMVTNSNGGFPAVRPTCPFAPSFIPSMPVPPPQSVSRPGDGLSTQAQSDSSTRRLDSTKAAT